MGARALLLDEDTCATNFMIRDARMQARPPLLDMLPDRLGMLSSVSCTSRRCSKLGLKQSQCSFSKKARDQQK